MEEDYIGGRGVEEIEERGRKYRHWNGNGLRPWFEKRNVNHAFFRR
jgi:hypothetical protein